MKSFKALAGLPLLAVMVGAKQNAALRRKDIQARHRDIAVERGVDDNLFSILNPGNGLRDNGEDGNGNACVSFLLFDT